MLFILNRPCFYDTEYMKIKRPIVCLEKQKSSNEGISRIPLTIRKPYTLADEVNSLIAENNESSNQKADLF